MWALYVIDWKSKDSLKVLLKRATEPKENWGPKSPALNREWKKFKADRKSQKEAAKKITNDGKIRRFLRVVFE